DTKDTKPFTTSLNFVIQEGEPIITSPFFSQSTQRRQRAQRRKAHHRPFEFVVQEREPIITPDFCN
ncbi:hypothetical protein KAW48_06270, partial [candidate division WOR-3 bacterium]|nr:hypothetical protein [candidate division WOR-3 bacterium]